MFNLDADVGIDTNTSVTLATSHVLFVSVGLLLYHGGRAEDFLAVELVNGFIHFLVNDGSGVRVLAARTTGPVRYQNPTYKPIDLSQSATNPTTFIHV